jgi:hypothetical protein
MHAFDRRIKDGLRRFDGYRNRNIDLLDDDWSRRCWGRRRSGRIIDMTWRGDRMMDMTRYHSRSRMMGRSRCRFSMM